MQHRPTMLAAHIVPHAAATTSVTACPACGGARKSPMGNAGSFDSLAGGKLFRQPPYEIYRCTDCSLFYKSDTLSAEALCDYYARLECGIFAHDGSFPTDVA